MLPDLAPAALAAWQIAGAQLAGKPDDRLHHDWHAVGDLLVNAAGHGDCGGWTFDPHTKATVCACGASPFAAPLPSLLVWQGSPAASDKEKALDLLAWTEGHGYCGGMNCDRETGTVTCRCGELAFRVVPVLDGAVQVGAA
jgi:hypothetical protein